MKTNHQRGFVANKPQHSRGFGIGVIGPISGKIAGAHVGYEFTNGNRGMAKSRRGAKKFVRTRTRFNENTATKKLSRVEE